MSNREASLCRFLPACADIFPIQDVHFPYSQNTFHQFPLHLFGLHGNSAMVRIKGCRVDPLASLFGRKIRFVPLVE